MAGFNSFLYMRSVLAIKHEQHKITKELKRDFETELERIIQQTGSVYSGLVWHANLLHFAFELAPTISVAELMMLVRVNTVIWMNKHGAFSIPFEWQAGFLAFSTNIDLHGRAMAQFIQLELIGEIISAKQTLVELLEEFTDDYNEKHLFEVFEKLD
jgi:hypothetical protein